MGDTNPGLSQRNYSIYIFLAAAIGFLVILLSMIRPDVFFSGDAGVKFLVIEQLQNSGEYKKIISDHPQWVQDIWSHGYYPYQPNFVYNENGAHFVTFPPAFQIINAFFYKQFGFYGLYILPALSVVLIWLGFLRIITVLKTNRRPAITGFFLLAFCTPLTFYGAVYWEHSLAALLAFASVLYLVHSRPSLVFTLFMGLLAGTTIWFREESVIIPGLVMAVVFFSDWKFSKKSNLVFIIATILPIVLYFVFNYKAFGNFMGVHGYQVVRDETLKSQLWKGIKQIYKINVVQLFYFPLIVFVLFIAWYLFRKKEWKTPLFQLALVIILFSGLTPFILPSEGGKQWGARFYLPLVAPVILLLTGFADRFNWQTIWNRYKLVCLLVIGVILYSLYLNTGKAAVKLRWDYSQRIYPQLKYIQADSCQDIVIDNQYIAQELSTQFRHKNFFLSDTTMNVEDLLAQLKAAGREECLMISIEKEKSPFPAKLLNDPALEWKNVGTYYIGKYKLK